MRLFARAHRLPRSAVFAALVVGALAGGGLSGVAAAVGTPPGPPPQPARSSPPPAWLEAGARAVWLAYGSYCWKTMCVDFLPPSLRDDIPQVAVRSGSRARVHFGFEPRRVVMAGLSGARWQRTLAARRLATWRVTRGGLILISATGLTGEASYLVTLRLRP